MDNIKEKFDSLGHHHYEHDRWFSTAILRSGYEMTKATIIDRFFRYLDNPKTYIEVGAGPGTWTKIFRSKFPETTIHLVDISPEMLRRAREVLGEANVFYHESDFIKYESSDGYDAFFSSRALEYIDDKESAVRKALKLLKPGGRGCFITKMPRYQLAAIKGRKVPVLHRGQILPADLRELLEDNGAEEIKVYPAMVTVPILKLAFVNKICFLLISQYQVNALTRWFCESYCLTFKKR